MLEKYFYPGIKIVMLRSWTVRMLLLSNLNI